MKKVCDVLAGSVIGLSDCVGRSPEVNWGITNVITSQAPIADSNAIDRRRVISTVTLPISAITIDSATLMNKGLEVIEARHLFGVDYDRIQVVIHPQSIIHSMVEYRDGAVIAQLGTPDMRVPIQLALTWPERWEGLAGTKLDFCQLKELTFEAPDVKTFPALQLAYEAGRTGGTMPAVLNAANEEAVHAFLRGEIGFPAITEVVQRVMEQHRTVPKPDLETVLAVDREARQLARTVMARYVI